MRNAPIYLTIMYCCVVIASSGCSTSNLQNKELSSLEEGKKFRWPEGKHGAISVTFDDARFSQIDNGLPILDEYGVKATFYVSISSMEKRLDAWKKAVANGHEIGNHSLTHPCSGNFSFAYEKALENYTLNKIHYELEESNMIIERLLDVRPVSFAYPCGQKYVGRGMNVKSYIPVVAENFLTGRGWMDEWSNNPAFCDMAQLMGVELDGKDFEQVKQWIDKTTANGGWLVFCGHDIGEGGRQTTLSPTLRALCEYAQDPQNGLWLDTVQTIGNYIVKQRTNQAD
ncbi:MAG: polysaccharide deacetylase family protein [Sedimentisphaerales bacterium]|nr:polysaccharide deacetylase family protein [Sedimentisphaerales bacterium]